MNNYLCWSGSQDGLHNRPNLKMGSIGNIIEIIIIWNLSDKKLSLDGPLCFCLFIRYLRWPCIVGQMWTSHWPVYCGVIHVKVYKQLTEKISLYSTVGDIPW
jgi:hypothetical protein